MEGVTTCTVAIRYEMEDCDVVIDTIGCGMWLFCSRYMYLLGGRVQ